MSDCKGEKPSKESGSLGVGTEGHLEQAKSAEKGIEFGAKQRRRKSRAETIRQLFLNMFSMVGTG